MRKKASSVAGLYPTVPGKDVAHACRVHGSWSWWVVQCLGLIGSLIRFGNGGCNMGNNYCGTCWWYNNNLILLHETKQLVSLYVFTDAPTFDDFASCHRERERNRRMCKQRIWCMLCLSSTFVYRNKHYYSKREKKHAGRVWIFHLNVASHHLANLSLFCVCLWKCDPRERPSFPLQAAAEGQVEFNKFNFVVVFR